jgi:hypothetical protein
MLEPTAHGTLVGGIRLELILWSNDPGEDLTKISSAVPEGCQVDQAAYVSRHGSRYPDQGAHNGWLEMARRVRHDQQF